MRDKIAQITSAYAGFRSGDPSEFLACFDEESVLIEAPSLPYGGEFRGPENVMRFMAQLMEVWTDIDFRLTDIVGNDRLVIAYGNWAATSRTTGRRVAMPMSEVWEFDGDRVLSCTPIYFDTAAAVAALAE